MSNNVNSPKHYTECSIECIEAMIIAYGEQSVFEFCKCNAFKYLWRFKNKNGLEDIAKSQWYIAKGQELHLNLYGMKSDELERLESILEAHRVAYIDTMKFKEEIDE